MSVEENKELVRRFTLVWHDRNLGALDDLLAPDFVVHGTGGESDSHGVEAWKQFVTRGFDENSEIDTGTEELLASGDLVAERWYWRSVERATGKAIRGHGITMHRIADGRLQEDWPVFELDTSSSE